MAESILEIVIRAKDEASAKLKSFGEVGSKVGSIMTVAGGAITGALALSVKAAAEAEKAQKQLEHATLNVAHANEEQLRTLEETSSALEKKGVLDGDNIKMGQAQLMTFGISADMANKLSGSLADLAVNQFGVNASGDQLTQTANMIAKALNGQFGVLEKSGIRFTEAQRNLIQFGNETERTAALQEGLAQNLKFTNEVALGTFEGKLAHSKVALENISESIGGVLIPVLTKFLESIQPVVEKITEWMEKNPELTQRIVLVAAAIGGLLLVIGPILVALPAIIAGFSAFGTILAVLSGPIGILIVLIGFLGAVFIANKDKIVSGLQVLRDAFKIAWDWINANFIQPFMSGFDLVSGVVQSLSNAIGNLWGKLKSVGDIKGIGSSVIEKILGRASGGPVNRGQTYIVGENGPEIFVPSDSGTIIPNSGVSLNSVPSLAGATGGNTYILNFSGNSFMGDEQGAEKVANMIMEKLRRSAKI